VQKDLIRHTTNGGMKVQDFLYVWFAAMGFAFGYFVAKAIAWIKEK
jgi:hypothetical protein